MPIASINPSIPDHAACVVLGGSGAVGRFLLRRLKSANTPVVALSRDAPPRWSAGWSSIEWRRGGLPHTPLSDLPAAAVLLSAGPLDALADACERGLPMGVKRIVALSSMSIDWKRDSVNPAERDLSRRLMQAEQRAQAALDRVGVALVIVRPGMIYGAGIDHSLSPLLRFAQRWRFLPWPAAAAGLRCPVHADDIAAALHHCAFASTIPSEPLRLAGAECLPFDRMIDRLLQLSAKPTLRLPLPLPLRSLQGLAAGSGRTAAVAATLLRSGLDQRIDTSDWQHLGLSPRGFVPLAQDFEPWTNG